MSWRCAVAPRWAATPTVTRREWRRPEGDWPCAGAQRFGPHSAIPTGRPSSDRTPSCPCADASSLRSRSSQSIIVLGVAFVGAGLLFASFLSVRDDSFPRFGAHGHNRNAALTQQRLEESKLREAELLRAAAMLTRQLDDARKQIENLTQAVKSPHRANGRTSPACAN